MGSCHVSHKSGRESWRSHGWFLQARIRGHADSVPQPLYDGIVSLLSCTRNDMTSNDAMGVVGHNDVSARRNPSENSDYLRFSDFTFFASVL